MKRQTTNAVNSRHARIILLSRGGVCNREIGERAGCSAVWVRQIIHRFNAHGIDGIVWYPAYCGRHDGSVKFTTDIVEQILEIALSPPKRLIGMNCWSLPKLRLYLMEQEVVPSISVSWLREILRKHRVRLRRTKTWKESNDPHFWRKYRAVRRLYRRAPVNGRVICVDEFGPLNLVPRAGGCLAGRGKRVERHRATYHRHGGVRHMFAAYDLKTDRLIGRFESRKNWQTFLSFLRWLRRRYRQGVLHIVLDNVGYHCKREVLEWAKRHRVRFQFTPTNASWLNRIECHLTAVRKFALDNSDHRTHEEQQQAIEDYLAWRNRRRHISLQEWRATEKSRESKRVAA
jgi:transposase